VFLRVDLFVLFFLQAQTDMVQAALQAAQAAAAAQVRLTYIFGELLYI